MKPINGPTQSVRQVMTQEPVTISPSVTLGDVIEILRNWGMRHLPVVDGDRLVGVISDRDVYKHLALGQTHKALVQDAMSQHPYAVAPSESLAKVATQMAENKFGCTVVVDADRQVKGIFTTTDALYILAQLLNRDGESEFHKMNIEDYLNHHQFNVAI